MAEATLEQAWPIFGREAELALLEAFVDPSAPTRGLFLTGEPGAGKTTLWEVGLELARRRGLRVLSGRASGAETQLAFTALIDLCDDVTEDDLAGLPSPQRRALEVALLRAEPKGDAPPDAAVALGFTNAVRALAARGPLLVAVDDVQWLDAASAEALEFAVPRLADHRVRFLFAKRSRSSSFLERAHGPKGLQRLEVGPLSFGATQRLLAERLGLSLPRHVLRRIVSATLGNALFALELGRVLGARGTLAIGEDVPMPEIVEEILGTRVAALPAPVRSLLLAVALSGDLRASQVDAIGATPAVLDEAVALGVLAVDGDRLRPAHPLFASAAKSRARIAEQREMHRALADIAADEESRALHLAHAADEPDEELAAALTAAVAGAFAPELVEALVELRELDEATRVTDRLRELAEAQQHPWGLATAARCGALIRIARAKDVDAAGAELAQAAEQYGELGLRFERARSLLSLGRAQRRQRKWGAARDALDQAAAEFDELGSLGWAQQARDERARVGGRRPSGEGELTPAERRVAELAADGLSNKEIARDLVVTVRTVEEHLKNAYAKLDVRSRTQLARRLLERA